MGSHKQKSPPAPAPRPDPVQGGMEGGFLRESLFRRRERGVSPDYSSGFNSRSSGLGSNPLPQASTGITPKSSWDMGGRKPMSWFSGMASTKIRHL